ncbi:DNA internalization-related competence protein ComEC/Rec2 [Ruminococcus sp. OA3]|uniref:DNA internalization-related competence protein ComEC/Rec2 n=1 Tax=Ruminococcus sp. OA3 TaxID=2914164 RepID=UPI001F051BF9|nr:DNA internalization-related competence protein ComEC/Rec2 [Ruminococcus sp. OA3]MCH1982133.1 DNA internalization-related competence protein ComEC/Rec2 [Ruminococcus sp. OA3]
MNKRPLCLLCIVIMAGIWLLEVFGVTYAGGPRPNEAVAAYSEENAVCRALGRVFRLETKSDTSYLYLRETELVIQTRRYSIRNIKIKLDKKESFMTGSVLLVTGELYSIPGPTNPGQFDQGFYHAVQKIDALMSAETIEILDGSGYPIRNFLAGIREDMSSFLQREAPGEAGVLAAMVLGDKGLLEETTRSAYQMGGIMHILAISGLHLTVIGMGVFRLLMKLGCGCRMAGCISAFLMVGYGLFTGSSVSAMRAVIMFALTAGARLTGRTYDLMSGLALSALLILAEYPGYLWYSGFLLSYAAVMGIGLILPALKRMEKAGSAMRSFGAVWVMTFPLTLYYFYELPVFAPLINLLLLPMLPLVLGSGAAGCLAGQISADAGRLLLLPGKMVLELYDGVLQIVNRIPFASWILGKPSQIQMVIYYFVVGVWILLVNRSTKQREKSVWKLLLPVAAVICLCFRLPGGLGITMLDVGQGDSFVFSLPSGSHYMLDGGSSSTGNVGTYRILPYLKSCGIQTLEGVFVTHGDEDHMNGIMEILSAIRERRTSLRINKLLLPYWMKTTGERKLTETAEASGISVIYLKKGDRIQDGDVSFTILHPPQNETPEDENSGSLTFKIELKKFSAVFTGDLCGKAEEQVAGEDISCQLLKVAHHGSVSSTAKEFLSEAMPDICFISCGADNRYGHPHPEVVKRIERAGAEIWQTAETGAVMLETDGRERLRLKSFLGKSDVDKVG